METVKPFAKIEQNIVTATIDENGDVVFLASGANDVFLELGNVVTKRASHVEPAGRYDRWLFHILRRVFGDKGRVAEWTRGWKTLWRVNTKPVGGPILTCADIGWKDRWAEKRTAVWVDRQHAIDAEIKFLNRFFLEGRR